jgi:hypothetical protein
MSEGELVPLMGMPPFFLGGGGYSRGMSEGELVPLMGMPPFFFGGGVVYRRGTR